MYRSLPKKFLKELYERSNKVTLRQVCKGCQHEHEIKLDAVNYYKWIRKQKKFKKAFPNLNSNHTSLLLTGFCNDCIQYVTV